MDTRLVINHFAAGSATHVCIGATDPDRTAAFFAAFGFVADDDRSMVRGLGQRTEIEITEASGGRRLVDYDLGPRGLDVYTRDIEATIAVAQRTGADIGPVGVVEIGPMRMRQVTIWGPDGVPLVAIESEKRRSSLLDEHVDELHSELHSLVWAVDDRDCEVEWFCAGGATAGAKLAFGDPAVATFMCLPDESVELNMCMLAGIDNHPIRFELLTFAGMPGNPFEATAQAGIQAIGFTVDGLDAPARIVSPGGVVVDLRAS